MNQRYVMGTFLSVQIAGDDAAQLTKIFFDEVQRLEELLSIYKPESDISQINQAANLAPIPVSHETYEVVKKALHYAEKSGGAFDPVVPSFAKIPSPLVGEGEGGGLGWTADTPIPTSPHRGGRGYQQVHLDPIAHTVFLAAPGIRLDLGGIGKGFALDIALTRVQRERSPESVLADFGGQLLFWHKNGSFSPETIIIENPVKLGEVLSTFQINSNCSISTSSNAERPGHLRNPRTGRPVEGSGSVTVVASTGTEAEAFSTAWFIEGRSGVFGLS